MERIKFNLHLPRPSVIAGCINYCATRRLCPRMKTLFIHNKYVRESIICASTNICFLRTLRMLCIKHHNALWSKNSCSTDPSLIGKSSINAVTHRRDKVQRSYQYRREKRGGGECGDRYGDGDGRQTKRGRDWLRVQPIGNFALDPHSKHAKYHRRLCPAGLPRHWSSQINMRATRKYRAN